MEGDFKTNQYKMKISSSYLPYTYTRQFSKKVSNDIQNFSPLSQEIAFFQETIVPLESPAHGERSRF